MILDLSERVVFEVQPSSIGISKVSKAPSMSVSASSMGKNQPQKQQQQ